MVVVKFHPFISVGVFFKFLHPPYFYSHINISTIQYNEKFLPFSFPQWVFIQNVWLIKMTILNLFILHVFICHSLIIVNLISLITNYILDRYNLVYFSHFSFMSHFHIHYPYLPVSECLCHSFMSRFSRRPVCRGVYFLFFVCFNPYLGTS